MDAAQRAVWWLMATTGCSLGAEQRHLLGCGVRAWMDKVF